MRQELIIFRGVKEGIFIDVSGRNLLDIKSELDAKLKVGSEFYKGTKLLGIRSEHLSSEDIRELELTLKYKYDFIISEEDLPSHLINPDTLMETTNDEDINLLEDTDEGMTKFINGTLRSGQVIEYEGNIVIIGDVNPGALIEAKGNIIVLGTLRGVAHAGKGGNLKAVVACYDLQPTQLRIGDKIARSPDEYMRSSRLPEVAKIRNEEVVIEPYLPNK